MTITECLDLLQQVNQALKSREIDSPQESEMRQQHFLKSSRLHILQAERHLLNFEMEGF